MLHLPAYEPNWCIYIFQQNVQKKHTFNQAMINDFIHDFDMYIFLQDLPRRKSLIGIFV